MQSGQSFRMERTTLSRLVAATALLLTIVGAPMRARAQTDDAPLYRWTLKEMPGDSVRYRIQGSVTQLDTKEGTTLDYVAVEKATTRSVTAEGEITVETVTESQKTTINGNLQNDVNTPSDPTAAVFSPSGLLVKVDDDPALGSSVMFQVQSILRNRPIPPKSVKIGDTWKTDIDSKLVSGTKVTLASTLIGREKLLGVETLKVKLETAIPTVLNASAAQTVHAQETYNVDPKNGRILQASYTIDRIEVPLPGGPLIARVEATRVMLPADAKTESGKSEKKL